MKWKDLTKAEMEHVREMGAPTLREFTEMAKLQADARALYPKMEPCWDCRFIAQKLGLPLKSTVTKADLAVMEPAEIAKLDWSDVRRALIQVD